MRATSETAVHEALAMVPGIPACGDAPTFAEPWQAQAFALAVALYEQGVFTWGEWAAVLGSEINNARATGDPDDGTTYYNHWMATLERLVAEKGLSTTETLQRTATAWGRAADRTPHGTPIELTPRDFD